ncbi:MAG TPA: protein kinase [Kofleriaceae bacterium]|nr:protein kinase [Kofleriaceae bacterium]
MTAQPGTTSGSFAPRLSAGVQLGDFVLGPPLWPLRTADAYRANGPNGPATVYVVHAAIAGNSIVRDHLVAGTRAAAAVPEHKHLVRTLAAGLTGDVLWIATEEVEGSLVRDMLIKKKQSGAAGFGARGTGNLITGVAAALADVTHGALSSESVIVSRSGRVRVTDLALANGTIAAMAAGLVPHGSSIAPEVLAGQPATGASDVYGVGALLYEALVGAPLERGGPRPSEVVPGTNSQIDEVVARACHRDPEKRFGRVDVLGEVVAEALGKGGAMETSAVPTLKRAPTLEQHVQQASLASEIGTPTAPSASGNMVVDRALAAALADTTEKWLVSKGRLDYGPFSLADVVAQIDKGEIVAGNVIMDKDSGARGDIAEHPLLGPLVDAARARLDDARRAQAEVRVQSAEKKRGALLYAVIALGVAGAGVGAWLVYEKMQHHEDEPVVASVTGIDGAKLEVKVNPPKVPPAKHRSGGTGGGGGRKNWGPGNASENLALDLSDDSDETETLDMGRVFAVYQTHGAQLGGCLQSTGSSSAHIGIIIDGPSGRINWVKVNDQATGALWGCINRVMRAMQFPTIHGPRTRAEFDINL